MSAWAIIAILAGLVQLRALAWLFSATCKLDEDQGGEYASAEE